MPKQSAEYFRNYRAKKSEIVQNREQEIFRRGIARCVEYMRERVAGSAITGYQAAAMIERSLIANEPAESEARRRFVDNLRRADVG